MSYLILPTASVAYAESLSSALWGISRPPAIRKPEDTQLYTSWIVHPTTGAVALYVPDDTRPVHQDADVQPVLDLLAPALTADELQIATDAVEEARGARISFKQLLEDSPSLAPALMTHEQAQASGWFEEEETL